VNVSARARRLAPASWAPWLAWWLTGTLGALAWWALGSGNLAWDEPVCLLRRVAHLSCPTCGLTRALAWLARGEWRIALGLHPWAPVLAVQMVAGWALWGVARPRGVGPLDRWLPRLVAFNAAALILIWLVRLATGALPPA
jgi:hypothetical protein